MKRRTRLLLIALGCTLLCLVLYLSTVIGKDGYVIRYHYSGWRTMNTVATILLAVSGAFLALNLAVSAYIKLRSKREKRFEQEQSMERQAKINESKKLRNPEDVRQFFIRICNEKPHYRIAHMIKDQLDKMNEQQTRFENLRETNDISMAANITQALQDAEDCICADCKSAINKYIVGDEAGFEVTAEEVYFRNSARLDKVQEFLGQLADFVSGKTEGGDAMNNLEIYAEAIRETMKEGL